MRFLWFLASGIHYLFFLLFSIFLAVTGTTISSSSTVPPVAVNGSTPPATRTTLAPTNASSTKSPFNGATTRPVSTTISTTPAPSTNTTIPTREDTSTVIALGPSGTQPSSTSGITAPPVDSTTLPKDNTSSAPAGDSHVGSNTASGTSPKEQPLKFWGIILISLAATAAVVAGFVGCCFYCRKNNF